MSVSASASWRRLDAPGRDVCHLEQNDIGWRLEGTAEFAHEAGPALISYAVQCDMRWQTVSGEVSGSVGERKVEALIGRNGKDWTLNGAVVPGLEHLVDLDFGFTPATNLQQLRRVSIVADEAMYLPVVWYDIDECTLTQLPQMYERRSLRTFWYQSPTVGYEALLELEPNGFIRRYPGLWEADDRL